MPDRMTLSASSPIPRSRSGQDCFYLLFEDTTSVWACSHGFRKGEYGRRTLVEKVSAYCRGTPMFRCRWALSKNYYEKITNCCTVSFTKDSLSIVYLLPKSMVLQFYIWADRQSHSLTSRRTGSPLAVPKRGFSVELSLILSFEHDAHLTSLSLVLGFLELAHGWWNSQFLAWCLLICECTPVIATFKRINNEFAICLTHRTSKLDRTHFLFDSYNVKRDEIYFLNNLTEMINWIHCPKRAIR